MTHESPSPEGTEPQMVAACTIVNKRPRDLDTYRAACAAAGDDDVRELSAASVTPNMTIWHGGRWLPVKFVHRGPESVTIDFAPPEPGATAARITQPDTPMYRRLSRH